MPMKREDVHGQGAEKQETFCRAALGLADLTRGSYRYSRHAHLTGRNLNGIKMSDRITLCDVAPRDGIQNEKIMLSSAQKLELIRRLAAAGMPWIEVASFASPKWVPQMADAEEVFRLSAEIGGFRPLVLILNDRGYERAVKAGAQYLRLVVAATDTDESTQRQRAARRDDGRVSADVRTRAQATASKSPAPSRPRSDAPSKAPSIRIA